MVGNKSREFDRMVVLVTGGCAGIGKQVARDLSELGASVTVCGRLAEDLTTARQDFQHFGLHVDVDQCDIRSVHQVKELVERLLSRHGRIDILINNAGYAVYRPFEESTLEEVLDILDVNLSGAMRFVKAVLPSMMARRSGRIVNISSIGGEVIITPNATYCAAKHGMVAWSKAIRYELEPFNVKVNVVCPGHTLTNFHDHHTFRRRDAYRSKRTRSLRVEEVSAAILEGIRRDRVLTYVPKWHMLMVWALNVAPFLAAPVWDRLAKRRIAQLYEQIAMERRERTEEQDLAVRGR